MEIMLLIKHGYGTNGFAASVRSANGDPDTSKSETEIRPCLPHNLP
jgi:hypothetical protein